MCLTNNGWFYVPRSREPSCRHRHGSTSRIARVSWTCGAVHPLDERNIQSYLETGALICLVGDPVALEAYSVIEQAEMKFVAKGQRVRMQLDELPGGVLEGTITEIAKTDLKVAPRELAVGNELPVAVDAEGVARPTETSYQARVSFDRSIPGLLLGDRGYAKILVEPQSLWRRGCRYLERTFNFKL